jgi:hypothetical protein
MTVWHGKAANLGWPDAILEFDDRVSSDDAHAQLPSVSLGHYTASDIIFRQATVPEFEESGNVTVIPARVEVQ